MTEFSIWNRYKAFVDPDMPWNEYKALHRKFVDDICGKRKDKIPYVKYLRSIHVEPHMRKDRDDLITDILKFRK